MNNIYSKIIALTKSIYLIDPKSGPAYEEQFFAGMHNPFVFLGGIGISWWYTKVSFKLVEDIAFMIIKDIAEFSGCDHKSVQNIIRKTLHEICVDKRIFNGDEIYFARKEILFSCKLNIDTKQFASIITQEILANIRKN